MKGKSTSKRIHVGRLMIFYFAACSPMIAVLVLILFFAQLTIASGIAQAVYQGQIQMFSMFAAIAPVFFAIYQWKRPDKSEMHDVLLACVFEVSISLVGLSLSFAFMIWNQNHLFEVGLPFFLAAGAGLTLVFFLLEAGGWFRPVESWIVEKV